MAGASDLFGAAGGIPEGDQLRTATATFGNNQTDVDITVLTESSGTGGVIYGVAIQNIDSSNRLDVNQVKVTIDGASERTLDLNFVYEDLLGTTGRAVFKYLPTPINYASSITFKLNYTTANTSSSRRAVLFYSLKA